jgi:hypothetical protein
VLRDLWAFARYARRLPRFLARPVGWEESRGWLKDALERRAANFLHVLERAVLPNARSPYLALLRHAGIEFGDVVRVVREDGLEGALMRLYDAGVRVTHDEFKGRRRLERPGMSLEVRAEDFDNPLLGVAVAGTTGGSRGPGTRVLLDLDHLAYRVAHDWLTAAAHGDVDGRPVAFWRPVPPGLAGLNNALMLAKRGIRIERWFAQNGFAPRSGQRREFLLTGYTVLASRLWGTPIPVPEATPAAEAVKVARWLADKASQGTPALLNASASSCVRVCLAAKEHGLEIGGTILRVGGEPFTEAKARVVRESGCRALVHYGMTEIGRIGIPCAAPRALDDVHLATDRLAVIQRDRDLGPGVGRVGAFHFTTLHPRSSKLMINTEIGDYGVLEDRDCGCAMGEVGLSRHLHSIRSYEKLTSEGMHFLGDELISALEETLPARFGGRASDYQLVEKEVDGLPRVQLVVSPRVGSIDERQVVACLLEALGRGPAYRGMMAGIWQQAETLGVVRREPYISPAAKILPLHILRNEFRRPTSQGMNFDAQKPTRG